MTRLQLVVECHGEESASQLLVRRVLHERLGQFGVDLLRPQRRRSVPGLLARGAEALLRYQRVAEANSDRVLWLLDHDDGCALESVRDSYAALATEGVRKATAFAFICREYESLFLEEPSCCASYYGMPAEPFYAGRSSRDAKGHISRTLPRGQIYKPTVDQAPLTARLQLDVLADSSESYGHLERAVSWLCDGSVVGLYPTRGL